MFKNLKRAGIVAALAVGSMAFTTTSAEAREHWRGRGDDTAAIAVGAGIIGLAVGAAIASNNDRGHYYGGGYYGRPRYYYRAYPRGYYYDRPYPRRYYYRDYRGWDRGHHRGWDRRYYRGW